MVKLIFPEGDLTIRKVTVRREPFSSFVRQSAARWSCQSMTRWAEIWIPMNPRGTLSWKLNYPIDLGGRPNCQQTCSDEAQP